MITQTDLIVVIATAIEAHGTPGLNARELNTVIRAATEIVRELHEPERPVIPVMGINAWLRSDHTGAASLWMARVLAKVGAARYAYPHDPSDFRRCVGLLIACPELRQRLDSMAETGKEWEAIVPHWPEWELWIADDSLGASEELYRRMRAVLEGYEA